MKGGMDMRANEFCVKTILAAISFVFVFMTSQRACFARDANDIRLMLSDGERAGYETDPFYFLNSDFFIRPGFFSTLPILVIDGDLDDEGWGGDATLLIFGGKKANRITNPGSLGANARVSRSGRAWQKPDYTIELLADDGSGRKIPLLGMRAASEWELYGMMPDKSLMRGYIARRVASRIMPFVPQARHCELLVRKNGGYRYEGVYLLSESVKTAFGIDGNDKSAVKYLARRDAAKRGTGRREAARYSGFGDMETALRDIDGALKILYSDDPEIFLSHKKRIDVGSFVDYFILNEFFMNYASGFFSSYMYKDSKGKLCIEPVWEFERAVDNDVFYAAAPDGMLFPEAPLYERLVKSEEFVKKAANRSRELARSVLAPDAIDGMIDATAEYIATAQARDRARWANAYDRLQALRDYDGKPDHSDIGVLLGLKSALPGKPGMDPAKTGKPERIAMRRQTDTFGQEIIRLRYLLRRHSLEIVRYTPMLMNGRDEMFGAEDEISRNSWLSVIFVTAFFGSIRIARRAMRNTS
jgi:hypothetical protein